MGTVKEYIFDLLERNKSKEEIIRDRELLEFFNFDRNRVNERVTQVMQEYARQEEEQETEEENEEDTTPNYPNGSNEPDTEYQQFHEKQQQDNTTRNYTREDKEVSRVITLRIPLELLHKLQWNVQGRNTNSKIIESIKKHYNI